MCRNSWQEGQGISGTWRAAASASPWPCASDVPGFPGHASLLSIQPTAHTHSPQEKGFRFQSCIDPWFSTKQAAGIQEKGPTFPPQAKTATTTTSLLLLLLQSTAKKIAFSLPFALLCSAFRRIDRKANINQPTNNGSMKSHQS